MKVYLRKGHHSVYDDLVKHPPKGVEYLMPSFVSASDSRLFDTLKKRAFSAYIHTFNKPHSIYVNSGSAELIHACSGIMIKNKKPWVIDTEHVASFAGFEAGRLEKVRRGTETLLASEYCKKIMPWTEAAKTSILNGLDASKLMEKIEVVYPAIEPVNSKKTKSDKTRILFISARFFTKGGRELLQAYEKLKKKYDIELTIISNVPEELKLKHPEINFATPNLPREEIISKFFAKADIFVLPSYMDTFGMVFLEAMSCGVPVVSTNTFAIPEILGKSGFTVDVSKFSWYGKDCLFSWKSWNEFERFCESEEKPEVVDALVRDTAKLIESNALRKMMGLAGRREVKSGKFSIGRRNSHLKRIYDEAVKS